MRIDVFHDTVCPWCRIGKEHLKLALQQWGGEAEVYYHPFFLNPDIPEAGANFREYMHAKGGGRVPLEAFFAGPREAGQRVGLVFNFEAIEHAPNSIRSHCLIESLPEPEQPAMIDAIYRAYFEDGRDIGRIDVLADIAAEQGYDRGAVQALLESGQGRQMVMQKAGEAARLGINGVPFFVIDSLFGFSGAQPPEMMLRAIQQAAGN